MDMKIIALNNIYNILVLNFFYLKMLMCLIIYLWLPNHTHTWGLMSQVHNNRSRHREWVDDRHHVGGADTGGPRLQIW